MENSICFIVFIFESFPNSETNKMKDIPLVVDIHDWCCWVRKWSHRNQWLLCHHEFWHLTFVECTLSLVQKSLRFSILIMSSFENSNTFDFSFFFVYFYFSFNCLRTELIASTSCYILDQMKNFETCFFNHLNLLWNVATFPK